MLRLTTATERVPTTAAAATPTTTSLSQVRRSTLAPLHLYPLSLHPLPPRRRTIGARTTFATWSTYHLLRYSNRGITPSVVDARDYPHQPNDRSAPQRRPRNVGLASVALYRFVRKPGGSRAAGGVNHSARFASCRPNVSREERGNASSPSMT